MNIDFGIIKIVDKFFRLFSDPAKAWFAPVQINRLAKANAKAKLIEAVSNRQIESEVKKIEDGRSVYDFEKGKIIDVTPKINEPTYEQLIASQLIHEKAVKDDNCLKAIGYAYEQIKDESSEVSQELPNDDWLRRWKESASEFSDEEMQEVWGRILAGELRNEGTFDYRTIDFIKNMNKGEADLVFKVSKYKSGIMFFPDDSNFIDYGITHMELQQLESLGLISGIDSIGKVVNYDLESKKFLVIFNWTRRLGILIEKGVNGKVAIPVFILSRLGQQVFSLQDKEFEPDIKYLNNIKNKISQFGVKVVLIEEKNKNIYLYNEQ